VVLASKSEFFNDAFDSGSEITIPFEDPQNLFPAIVEFIYNNRITVTADTVFDALFLV